MTKYSMVFSLLLSIAIGNALFIGLWEPGYQSNDSLRPAKLEKGATSSSKQSVNEKPVELITWKESAYFDYMPYAQNKAQDSNGSGSQKPDDGTIISKGIKYVKVPFHDKHIYVSSDYYKAGGIRKPLSLKQAQKIARENDAVLPTKEMVDVIWKHADLKLKPLPLQAGPLMTKSVYFNKHNSMIDDQISNRSFLLVAGHKKDIVRPQRHGRVTIYGWHRTDGKPIQPPSNVHDNNYADYSHGLRLVKLPS